jgi:acetyl-CoA carboxylase biotin carboxylase subunit
MFRRILIANRGEIADRIMRACRALGIETVAVYSEADRDSPHLAAADEAICIGPARSGDSYLKMEAVLQAALQTRCQAVHPGYGFLSENPLFARRCELQKTTFIGPPARALALLGDKAMAKRTMRAQGLATIPGSEGVVTDVDDAAREAARAGYPVLLKASAGGGGKGMRLARSEAELHAAFVEASLEAEKAFDNASLYVEKLLEGARHIELQILADSWGRAVHLGERDCSIQRSHQKLLEESPSPAVSPEERDALGRRTAKALAAIGYSGAGTVEFLRDARGNFYFMEVNARLQVEHPVTETVTGLDLVQKQIRIAAGEPLGIAQEDVVVTGHAIELRINAEDPDAGFRPDPGTVTGWAPPASVPDVPEASVRLDSHVRAGYVVPPFYDSLLGKLILGAPSRERLLEAAARAVEAFRVEGVKTTLPLHARVLASSEMRSGDYGLGTLEAILGGHAWRS